MEKHRHITLCRVSSGWMPRLIDLYSDVIRPSFCKWREKIESYLHVTFKLLGFHFILQCLVVNLKIAQASGTTLCLSPVFYLGVHGPLKA